MNYQSQKNIAILFFSRSAESEAAEKSLAADGSLAVNTRLAEELISHTERQIAQSKLPCIPFDESRQRGHTFGERFANAFGQLFAMGFDYVISVGNDTPGLKTGHLEKAAQKLITGEADVVLGPARDGGTWLTAYSKAAFDADKFRELPWQSSRLFQAILNTLEEGFSVSCLSRLADIDDAKTLWLFLNGFNRRLRNLRNTLRAILPSNIKLSGEDPQQPGCALPLSTFPQRAPPLPR